jgi:hypothetical protein
MLAGSLHDHSLGSDGDSRDTQIVEWLASSREQLGIDYAALTDHSDFFPLSAGVVEAPVNELGLPPSVPPATPCSGDGCVGYVQDTADPVFLTDLWRRLGDLSVKYSGRDFGFVRGFEWTNDQQNHLNVLLSSNWTSRAVTGDAAMSMKPFWAWFDTAPLADPTGHGLGFGGGDGVGMFNHPGDKGALNWDDYGLDDVAARRMALIEIHGDQSRFGRGSSDAGWYWFALAKGWTVSPTMDWDWHEWRTGHVMDNPSPGAAYGVDGFLPGQRTLILAEDARPASIRSALLARRTSATEIPDLWASIRSHDAWQGSTVSAGPGDRLQIRVDAGSGTEALTRVEIVSDNGVQPGSYYYADNSSWNTNHSQLTPSFVVQHSRYVASGGDATRKARIDTPPPGTVVASAPLAGSRDSVTIDLRVPTAASPRPDGRHFFYAVVYAGDAAAPARCWTGPLLSSV